MPLLKWKLVLQFEVTLLCVRVIISGKNVDSIYWSFVGFLKIILFTYIYANVSRFQLLSFLTEHGSFLFSTFELPVLRLLQSKKYRRYKVLGGSMKTHSMPLNFASVDKISARIPETRFKEIIPECSVGSY